MVNKHVTDNQDVGATEALKLDQWINVDMANEWGGPGACPQGWANLCEDAGFDVTNWSVV